MKEIRCDHCKGILKDNAPRYKATVQKLSNERRDYMRNIVWEAMDFCNAGCLSNFIIKRTSNES